MMRQMLGAAVVILAMANPAAAAMNCGEMLNKASSDLGKMDHISSEKRAAMHRMVVQGYDYCMAGDEFNARKFFEMLEKDRR
jgi:hypothetical protein